MVVNRALFSPPLDQFHTGTAPMNSTKLHSVMECGVSGPKPLNKLRAIFSSLVSIRISKIYIDVKGTFPKQRMLFEVQCLANGYTQQINSSGLTTASTSVM